MLADNPTRKMQWFIDKVNTNTLSFDIESTHRNYGTICMPTGTGKSAKIYANIISNIKKHAADGWKKNLVVNLNSPILKLNQQLVNDLLEVLSGTSLLDSDDIKIYVNSSDDKGKYTETSDRLNFTLNSEDFKKVSSFSAYKLNIVTSCNPSLYHFYKKLGKMDLSSVEVISYLDEAHTITMYGDESQNGSSQKNKESQKPDVKKLCSVCDKVYAFSATPDPNITKTINSFETSIDDNSFIILITPSEAIASNDIIPPRFRYVSYTKGADRITADLCKSCIEDAKALTPEIHHKVLVTCKDSVHLKELRKSLEKAGYKVFSTCSRFLYNLIEEDNYEEAKIMNVEKFTRNIENYDGDCFVLHIRQMICGIDVKGLTDTIIYDNFTGATSSWRVYVQTIGRILRCAAGERGMKMADRKKKYGNVYFYNPEKDDNQMLNIAEFFTKVYGITSSFEEVFKERSGSIIRNSMTEQVKTYNEHTEKNSESENIYIEDIKIKIEKVINNYKKNDRLYKLLTSNEVRLKSQIYNDICKSISRVSDEFNTVYITNTQETIKDFIDNVGKSLALW